ncbi:hypothetical protein AMTRI_Chr04g184620 [Amborella trichopoda]
MSWLKLPLGILLPTLTRGNPQTPWFSTQAQDLASCTRAIQALPNPRPHRSDRSPLAPPKSIHDSPEAIRDQIPWVFRDLCTLRPHTCSVRSLFVDLPIFLTSNIKLDLILEMSFRAELSTFMSPLMPNRGHSSAFQNRGLI